MARHLTIGAATVLAYWLRVFRDAFVATFALIIAQPVRTVVVAVVLFAITFGMHRLLYGREAAAEQLQPTTSYLAALLVLGFVVFIFQLLITPAQLSTSARELNERLTVESKTQADRVALAQATIARLERRVSNLVQRVPTPHLTEKQRSMLIEQLRMLGQHDLSIVYLDTPTSGATKIVWLLADMFRDAGWHVEVYPKVIGYETYEGFRVVVESPGHIDPLRQAVLDALSSAEIQYGLIAGKTIGSKVEFVVGEF